jgi:hypothetical protein
MKLRPTSSFLELGEHEVAESLRELGIGPRPLMTRYYVERSGILPAGEVAEEGVRPLDGFAGADREGEHRIFYTEQEA